MNGKILTSTLLTAAITLAFSDATSATERPSASRAASHVGNIVAHPQPGGGSIILLDQTSSPGTSGVLTMHNLDAGSESYDTEMADDFQVPAGGWAVAEVSIGSFYQSGTTTVTPSTAGNIVFYSDSAGSPGAAISGCTYSSIPLTYNSGTGYSTLILPTECALPAGTFWMAFSGDLAYSAENGGVYVVQQTTTSGLSAIWRNPGDGFSSGCTNWTVLTSCGFSAGDMTFVLRGRTTPVSLQSFDID